MLGVAILENAAEQTARIVAVEPEDLLEVEPRLLDEARALMARLPFDQIDVLIVGELGKNYSGTGLDPNVIGRQRVETMPDLPRPVITRLAVLDLSVETRGNAIGIGLADLTTERLVRQIDPDSDAGQQHDEQLPHPGPRPPVPADRSRRDRRLPRHLLADRRGTGPDGHDPQHARADHLWVTPPIAAEVEAHPELDVRDRLPADPAGRAGELLTGATVSPRACGAALGGRDWA